MARKKKTQEPEFHADDSTEVEFHNPETGENYGGTLKVFEERFKDNGFELTKRADDAPLTDEQAQAAEAPEVVEPDEDGEEEEGE